MAQIKVYGCKLELAAIKQQLSDVIHGCVVDALKYPPNKRAHRFFPLEDEDFSYPEGRTRRYTIIELSMFEGRSVATKKRLIGLLFERIERELAITPEDVEITITETPKHNWGIRGMPADELTLDYKVEV